ncbi:beta-ketoacyl-ACP synthase 3 [Streptomyces sp. SYSU K217416]
MSNTELCARLDTTDEWIRSRTGIVERYIAGSDVSTEDLAAEAAAKALSSSGGCQVQALVLATTTPDLRCPATAPAVASRLGLTGITALDVAAGCTGFLYGLATAVGFIASWAADAVLVIGADRLSTLPAPDDRMTVPLFGDGAGAMLVRRGVASEDGAVGPMVLGSDGTHADLIRAPHAVPLHMQGAAVFRHAVGRMSSASAQAAQAAGWCMEDVDHLVPHQANARITSFVAHRLGIPDERQLHNVEHVGNTGAASIPLLLAQSAADSRLMAGHRVLLTAFGAGLTWGAATVTWPDLNP